MYNKNGQLHNLCEHMLEEFLKKLGANTKTTVGVSITPGVGVEMIEVDKNARIVNKYGFRPLEYDYSTRQIVDYDEFKQALEELFEELKIQKDNNVLLNVPNVHFGTITLPLLLSDDAITNAIISEVEQSYIFKRIEPIVSWVETSQDVENETRAIAYTAIQKTVLDKFMQACDEVGCKLIGVDTSHASFLKAMDFAGGSAEQMKDDYIWNLMVIGQNQYSFFSMSGKKVIQYYEEPLALKSFVDDEIYNAITSSAQLTLAGLPANYLFIASETDLVSAKVLSMRIPFEGQINYLECNKYKEQQELMPVNLEVLPNIANKMSPEAIGIGVYQFSDYPLKFNLLGNIDVSTFEAETSGAVQKVTIGNIEIELTPEFLNKVVIMVAAIILIPLLGLMFGLSGITTSKQDEVNSLSGDITRLNSEVSKYSSTGTTFDSNDKIKTISTQNRSELMYLSSLRFSVPKNVWITYYMTNSKGQVDVKGRSLDVESVYNFYKSIKDIVTNSNVRLYKLEIVTDSLEDVIEGGLQGSKAYEFEITNMSAQDLSMKEQSGAAGQVGADGEEGKKKSIFDFVKPSSSSKPGALPKNLQSIEKF